MKRLLYWSAVILLLVGLVCMAVSCGNGEEDEQSSASHIETYSAEQATESGAENNDPTSPASSEFSQSGVELPIIWE
ncbi:MAG: hypothetical protein ACI3XQ_02390 [Eubacteriales bacterium]